MKKTYTQKKFYIYQKYGTLFLTQQNFPQLTTQLKKTACYFLMAHLIILQKFQMTRLKFGREL